MVMMAGWLSKNDKIKPRHAVNNCPDLLQKLDAIAHSVIVPN